MDLTCELMSGFDSYETETYVRLLMFYMISNKHQTYMIFVLHICV